MTKKLLALVVLLAMLPAAQAHASPQPLDNEVQILADEASDAFELYDGFDIQDLYLREGVLRSNGEAGIILRPIIYGGFGPAPVAQTMNLDFSFQAAGQPYSFRLTSTDGENWEGANVIEHSMEATETGIGLQGSLQIFVSYADMGVQLGDELTDFRLVSLADEDPRDQSPGGYYVPGTGGAGELAGEGQAMVESYTLIGSHGYTESTLRVEDDLLIVEVTNLITVIGQHIQLELPEIDGWEFVRVNASAAVAEPGQHPTFSFRATSEPGADAATIAVTTDLQGREELTLAPASEEGSPVPMPEPEPDATKDSPGPFALIPLAAAFLLRRR